MKDERAPRAKAPHLEAEPPGQFLEGSGPLSVERSALPPGSSVERALHGRRKWEALWEFPEVPRGELARLEANPCPKTSESCRQPCDVSQQRAQRLPK